MIYEHEAFPAELRERIYAWLRETCAAERKPNHTDEQFFYNTRKKGFGRFKKAFYEIPDRNRKAIAKTLEKRFDFLFRQLNVKGTAKHVKRFVKSRPVPLDWEPPAMAAVAIGRDEEGE